MRPPYHSAILLGFVLCSTTATGAGPTYTDWGTPGRLVSIEAPGYRTLSPFVSRDGSRLYFGSDRPGGAGAIDIWVATWNDLTGEWNPPVNLGEVVNSHHSDWYPALSRDEHWLFFISNREGGFGGYDLWASYREHVADDLGWQAAVNLGAAINTPGDEASPSFFANDDGSAPQLFFTSTASEASADLDVYVANMIGPLEFVPAAPVAELNTVRSLPASKGLEISVSLRQDGLEIYLTSNRPGSVSEGQDIWVSTRDSIWSVWLPPVNAGPIINTAGIERDATISGDRQRLFFSRLDGIYQSTRQKARQP
jgi:hypothetical protein